MNEIKYRSHGFLHWNDRFSSFDMQFKCVLDDRIKCVHSTPQTFKIAHVWQQSNRFRLSCMVGLVTEYQWRCQNLQFFYFYRWLINWMYKFDWKSESNQFYYFRIIFQLTFCIALAHWLWIAIFCAAMCCVLFFKLSVWKKTSININMHKFYQLVCYRLSTQKIQKEKTQQLNAFDDPGKIINV